MKGFEPVTWQLSSICQSHQTHSVTSFMVFCAFNMPQLTPQQRAYVVSEFHRTQSVTAVLRNFRQRFPNARCPSRPTVYANVYKYEATGTSLNLNRGRSGRPRTARSVANVQAVQNALQRQWQPN